MKNMKYIALVFSLFLLACSGSESDSIDNNIENTLTSKYNTNELTVYSVPSPAFVSSVLKNVGIQYSDKLLDETKNSEANFGVSSKKFMNLGIYIVDFNYAYLFDQQPTAYVFIDKIDNLLKDLQLNNPKLNRIMADFKENKDLKDSVRVYVNEIQEEVNNYLIGSNAEANGLYLLTGMYIEGLYLTLSTFPNVSPTIKSQYKSSREINQLLLQHQVQLDNIISLFENMSENRADDFLRDLGKLKYELEKLKISYHINKTSGQIEKVNFDRSKMKNLYKVITDLRTEIIKN